MKKKTQIIVAPVIIPNSSIYRDDKNIGEYYVIFDEETSYKLVEKFNKNIKEFKINVDQGSIVTSTYIKSSWIIEDEEKDKSRAYGFNLPKGTWMVELKIEDSEFWEKEVKNNEKFGFSVEGLFELEKIEKIKNNN